MINLTATLALITEIGLTILYLMTWAVLFWWLILQIVEFFNDDDNWPHGGATGGA